MRMQPLGQFRVFAGHYQFILSDAEADPLEDVPQWDDKEAARTKAKGYVASDSAAFINSRAHLNDIVVRVFMSDQRPKATACDRQFNFNMSLPSGELHVTSLDGLDSPNVVSVPPGEYAIYVRSFNLGVDEMSTGELSKENPKRMSDAKRLARHDFEHHQIVLVPL